MTTALLVIDIQNDYFPNGKMSLTNPEQAAQNAARLLSHFRQAGAPVFHVQHITEGAVVPFFHPNTEGVEIHESVFPIEGESVIVKHTPNSFFQTPLHEKLQEQSIKELIVCGMMSHMCIDATVRSAVEHEYSCQVVEDACATKTLQLEDKIIPAEHVHYTIMAALNGRYATVTTTDAYLQKIK